MPPEKASDWNSARAPDGPIWMNARSPPSGRRSAPAAAEGVFAAIAADGPSAAHLPSGVKNAYSVRREWCPGGMRIAPFFCGTASGCFARNAAFVIVAG